MRLGPLAVVCTLVLSLTGAVAAHAAPAGPPPDPCRTPIRPAPVIAIEPCDGIDRIVAKAANVVPTPRQVAWQRQEVLAFTHYGMNTFTDREWGSGAEDPAWFAPRGLDVEQWMRAYRAAGAKLVMLTVKHHDGFVLYPTRYSNHSVVAGPWWIRPEGCSEAERVRRAREEAARFRHTDGAAFWRVRDAGCRNPAGDVFGQYVRAARAAGLKVGIYLSPSDGAEHPHAWHADYVRRIREKQAAGQPLTMEERVTLEDGHRPPGGLGRYGNGSAIRERTIPTLVPGDDRAGAALPSFRVRANDYDAYYLNQIYELLTQYDPIDEFWLDGANPWAEAGLSERYDFPAWFRLIHALSPNTVIDEGPHGVRWVGNERGVARESEWSPTPYTAHPASDYGQRIIIGGWPDGATAADLGSRARLADPSVRYVSWMPAESDVSIRPGWFYHANQAPKSAAQLVDLYQRSVGRNSVLLLNVPPDPAGRVADADVSVLTAFGDVVRRTYHEAEVRRVFWRPPRGATTGDLVLDLGGRRTFDEVSIGEGIEWGQRVEAFAVDVWTGTEWRQVASATTIGNRRILPLSARVETDRLRVRIVQARATPLITSVGLHLAVAP